MPGILGTSHGALQFMAYEELKKIYSVYYNRKPNEKLVRNPRTSEFCKTRTSSTFSGFGGVYNFCCDLQSLCCNMYLSLSSDKSTTSRSTCHLSGSDGCDKKNMERGGRCGILQRNPPQRRSSYSRHVCHIPCLRKRFTFPIAEKKK